MRFAPIDGAIRRPVQLVITMLAPVLVAGLLAAPVAAAPAATSQSDFASGTSVSESLATLISDLPVDNDTHSGYDRTVFRLWVDANGNGCDTREDVGIAEATQAPTRGSSCTLSGGRWSSGRRGHLDG